MFWWAIALSALGHGAAFVSVAWRDGGPAAGAQAGLSGAPTGIGIAAGNDALFEIEATDGPRSVTPPGGAAAAANEAPSEPAAAPAAKPIAAPVASPTHAALDAPDPQDAEPPAPKPIAKAPKRAAKAPPKPSEDPYDSVDAERAKASRAAGKGASAVASAGAGEGPGGATGPASGSLGGAGGVGDLGRALTRAIPAANQGDASWGAVAVGFTRSLDVRIPIDADGRVGGFEPLGEAPAPELLRLMRRTLGLVMGGTFALRPDSVGAGAQVLRVRVVVAPAAASVADPEALAFRYENGRGTAAFIPDGGPRVEVTVEVLRVEATGVR